MKYLPRVGFFAVIFVIGCFLFYKQSIGSASYYHSDLPEHLRATIAFFAGERIIIHSGFHTATFLLAKLMGIEIGYSAALVLATALVAIAMGINIVLTKFLTEEYSQGEILCVTALLLLVSAIYLPFFNHAVYRGQGSPNVWHSPTLLAVKAFVFPCILLIHPFLAPASPKQSNNVSHSRFWLTAVLLCISVWMKPSFVLSFFPAVLIFVLIKQRMRHENYVQLLVMFAPAIFLLALQSLAYPLTKDAVGIKLDFLGVWRVHSPNVFISFLLVTAFPLSVLIIRFKQCMNNDNLLLSWINLCIGFMLYMLLAEKGVRYSDGNFGWSRMIGLQLVFVFSTIEFLKWIAPSYRRDGIRMSIPLLLFFLHAISGTYYFLKIMSGGEY